MADRPRKSMESSKTVQSLCRLRKEIQGALVDRLKASWRADKNAKINMLLREQQQKNDFFSALIRRMSGEKVKHETQGLESVIQRMRSKFFSSEDLFLETNFIEDAIEETIRHATQSDQVQTWETMQAVRMSLRPLMALVLRETAGVYEEIVKSGQRGFCLFDAKGKIVSTNPEMDRLFGTETAPGKPLKSFLNAEGQKLVHNMLTDKGPGESRLMRMKLIRQKGKEKDIGVELASFEFPRQRRKGYFCAVDLTEQARMEKELYENSPLGVIRLKLNGDFTYINKTALNFLGLKNYDGLNVKSILPDSRTLRVVKDHLKRRRDGMSDEYRISVCRKTDGKKFPVMIAAMPERDLHGNVVGSLAILRDLTLETASENIHKYITSSAKSIKKIKSKNLKVREFISSNPMLDDQTTQMLAATSIEVSDILPFDFFVITRFSESMTHLRKLFFLYPNGQMNSYVRWWEISKPLREGWKQLASTVKSAKTEVIKDYEKFLNLPQNKVLKDLPEFQWILQQGFKSGLSHFVIHQGKLLASISLLSKKKKSYIEDHKRMLANLPLGKVVLLAIQSEQKSAEKFRLELLNDIIKKCDSIDQVAKVVVEGIGKGHLWSHIALYMIDEKEQEFRLLHQRNLGKVSPLREPFTQALADGVLGWVYKNKKHVLIQNKAIDSDFHDIYLASVPGMMSELCLPIEIGDKVRWFLNIEDSNQNAFSDEEINGLRELLDEIGSFLDRIWVRHFLLTTLSQASDIVFITNAQGYLEHPNTEAILQLEYTKEEMAKIRIEDIIVEPDAAKKFSNLQSISNKEVNLRRKNDKIFPVLLSASPLPKEFGGKVMICKDLSLYKRVEELEYLGKMYHEIAVQTQTPLSLAFGWLQSLKDQSTEQTAIETLDKALRQLRKIEITYNRLALYDQTKGVLPYNEVLFSMLEIVAHINSIFPISEGKKIAFQLNEPLPYLKGDLFQLNFCFESILSFLLRHLPPEENIQVNVSCVKDWVVTQIRGFLPRPAADRPQTNQESEGIAKTLAQMALNSEVIERFVINHKGTIAKRRGKGYEQIFDIRLPVDREEALT